MGEHTCKVCVATLTQLELHVQSCRKGKAEIADILYIICICYCDTQKKHSEGYKAWSDTNSM